jgi:putative hydrolase of HD superfamily
MDSIARYIFEAGQLKRVKRSGWWGAGIDDPESVAEHSFRTAIIGYLLGVLAGADPQLVCAICVFHDMEETRTNDSHIVANKYLDVIPGKSAFRDQVADLPNEVASSILDIAYSSEVEGDSLEKDLAHDADLLECMIQAIEYREQGHRDVEDWITNCKRGLRHPISIELAKVCLRTPPGSWWDEIIWHGS